MIAPSPRQAPRPRQPVRTAKNATQRRLSRKERARYRSLQQFCVGLAASFAVVMLYVYLTAHLTSLNYAYARAEHERAALQGQTARFDERLAALRSDERLSAIAARLHMQDPQQFALVTLPAPQPQRDRTHLAFLSGLATLFGAK